MLDQGMSDMDEDGGDRAGDEDVVVIFRLSNQSMGTQAERLELEALAAELERATQAANVGDYEGDEFGGGECVLFFSGPDSARLIDVLRTGLKQSPIGRGAKIARSAPGEDGAEHRQPIDP